MLAFSREYLKDFNAAAASIRAGYSPRGAKQHGYKLLQNPGVLQAIEEGKARLAKRTEHETERISEKLRTIAFRPVDVVEDPKPAAVIVKALELLGKQEGMFPDRTKLEGAIGLVPLTPEQAARLDTKDLEAIVALARKARGEA
ncbi:terminase small subunit [bacterium]|nr:terminase small subunit [bacterium]